MLEHFIKSAVNLALLILLISCELPGREGTTCLNCENVIYDVFIVKTNWDETVLPNILGTIRATESFNITVSRVFP